MEKLKKLKNHLVSLLFLAFIFAMAILLFVLPKAERSENEKRELSDFPKITLTSIADGTFSEQIDTYCSDHFPFRDFFVGVNAYWEQLTGRNGASGVYKSDDDYLITAPENFDPQQTALNVTRFAEFTELTGLSSSMMIVPTAGYILEDKLPASHKEYHDAEIFSIALENAKNIELIDLRESFMSQKDSTQIYYKTDHHLTSAGTDIMYERFCAAQNIEPKEFKVQETSEGFYGTTYSRSGLWRMPSDTLEIWSCENPGTFTVTIDDGLGAETYDTLYFRDHLENMDQYPVFLNGNHSVVTVENEECQNGKRLLLIKDSYAHCFATFAIENYETICMVDLRYFRGDTTELIEQYDLNEILYLYGAENISSSTDTAWLIPLA